MLVLFSAFGYYNKAALNMYAQVFMWRYIFIFVGNYLCVELLGHMMIGRLTL